MNREQLRRKHAIDNGADFREMSLRVVDYARVSTDSLAQKKSFDNQLETYRRIILQNPNWMYAGTYSDEAVTGTKIDLRGGFQQMLEDGKGGKFDLIIVKSVSRFARNIKECLTSVDDLRDAGVMIYFFENNLNTFQETSTMMLKFMALGADMEAAAARSRTNIVFAQGIQQGKVYGNSRILGYRKENCTLVLDEREVPVVQTIFDLYVHERMGLRKIANELVRRGLTRSDGQPVATRTIKCVLENPKYKGYYCGRKSKCVDTGKKYVRHNLPETEWLLYPDPKIPAIVSEKLWDEAAKLRNSKNRKYHEEVLHPCNEGAYPYSSKIESEALGGIKLHRTVYTTKSGTREGWHCRNYRDPAHPEIVGPTIYSDELDEILKNLLTGVLGDYESVINELASRCAAAMQTDENPDPTKALEAKCQKAQAKIERLLALYEAGGLTMEEYLSHVKKPQQELAQAKLALENYRPTEAKTTMNFRDVDALKGKIRDFIAEIHPGKELVDTLIERVVVRQESTKKHIILDCHVKVIPSALKYAIERPIFGKSKASVTLCNCFNSPSTR